MEDIKLDFKILSSTSNIAEELENDQLHYIGRKIVTWYDIDEESRAGWKEKQDDALKLALQIYEEKSYPWPNAANVKFPLLTVGAVQFSARVYPTLVRSPDLVRFRVVGDDKDGKKAARANRISRYISYQLLEENEDWETQQDRLFIIVPIVGCAFKKTYYDTLEDRCRSKLVLPQDLVCHYYTKTLESAERKTEVFQLFSREVQERMLKGTYITIDLDTLPTPEASIMDDNRREVSDERQGISVPWADEDTPRIFLESHCWLDLDGDDLKEPYVVTVEKSSGKVFRIVSRFKKIVSKQSLAVQSLKEQVLLIAQSLPAPEEGQQISEQQLAQARQAMQQVEQYERQIEELESEKPDVLRIVPREYYTKYSFIPSPDGGFYDLGFGQLLGPITHSINTILNQLIDAGTMSVGSQGFISRGARIKGGKQRFEPFEWKTVNASPQALKDSFMPLPINPPSPVLFSLLGMLIQYGEKISTISEALSGENPGQNTPAFNMNSMLEQGLQVFNGVFKRMYNSFRSEIRKVYECNAQYLDLEHYVTTLDGDLKVSAKDFEGDPKDLAPAADPNAFSNLEKITKAQFLAERAQTVPGYSPIGVEKRLLESMSIPDVNEVYPIKEDGSYAIPPPPDKELEIEANDLQRKLLEGKVRGEIAGALADADIGLKEAQTIKIMMEAGAIEKQAGIEQFKIVQERIKARSAKMMARLDILMKKMDGNMKTKDVRMKLIDLAMKKEDLVLKEKDREIKEIEVKIKEKQKNEKASAGGGSP